MQFDTLSKEARPVRLSEQTRAFAYESLYEFRYGLDTERCAGVEMDETKGFGAMPPLARYDAAVAKIAAEAPVRICAGEKISGAATLGGALKHCVPAYFRGEPVFPGVSHLTVDYKTVLSVGYEGLRARICAAEAACADRQKLPFYRSLKNAVDSFEAWHARYLAALDGRREYENNYRILSRVPKYGATCFYEAVQSIWFTFAFLRLCGNWPGIGRLDALLGGYLKRDLAEGRLTLAEAREILAHFFIKGCEWITGKSDGSGDAQHYQNIVLAGTDGRGRDVTNEVTYLVLDIVEELGIGDFPIAVRIGKNTEEKLLVRIAEVIRHGGGIVAVYNEDLILKSLAGYGYPAEEAAEFANDGCWEVQIPGKTQFTYIPVDALALLQKKTLNGYEGVSFDSFEALYAKFTADLNEKTEAIFSEVAGGFGQISEDPKQWRWKEVFPCSVISLFEEDCIGRGLSYLEGGAVYNVFSPHIGGVADAANSLLAIRKIVFEEKRVSFNAFMEILRKNWEGAEPLRRYALHRIAYYGNDSDEADGLVAQILDDFAAACGRMDGRCPVSFPPGVSTFGRQIGWAAGRLASPHGRLKGEVLAGNCSPTPGTDCRGATAVIASYCKADLAKQVTGAALDLPLLPSAVSGEEGIAALVALMRGFVALGGYFLQADVADPDVFKRAQEHPEAFPALSVRISGWNARFVTLDREWQNMIIERDAEK